MNRVDVKPQLIRWARERAGVSVPALSKRFPKIESWELGEVKPTLKQLEAYANATHAPIGYLFLQEPPVESVPIPDFRTVANARVGRPSPDLLDTIHLCQQRQDWYREFARSLGDEALPIVGAASSTDDVVATAAQIREAIALDAEERARIPTWTDALRKLIEKIDGIGILVMVSGVVGSNNKRKLEPQEFRGFALADDLAPLIFVNGADSKAAQMFTLAHELAHVWLGESAVSDSEARTVPEQAVERWCNQVAAELLVPMEDMARAFSASASLESELNRLARHFKVSTLVVLRRIHDLGGLSAPEYWDAYEAELERLRKISSDKGGGNFYLTLGARAGKTFARALVVSTLEGRTSYTEAFRLLGFKKMETFEKLGHSLGVLA